jgi:hypothetical protein
MGAGASSKRQRGGNVDHDFSRLKVNKKGIRITEAYDSDVDEEFHYDSAHLRKNEASSLVADKRDTVAKDGLAKVVAAFDSLHPHTKTGKHLLADNGRQWGDDEAHIPDMALDFVYGFTSGESCRQSVAYTETGDLCYLTGGTAVTYIHAGATDDGDDEDLPHRQCSYFQDSCNNDFSCMCMHKDGHIAAVGEYGPMARVYVFNCYTMEVLARPSKIPQEGVASVSFSAGGTLLATVDVDKRSTLSVFDGRVRPSWRTTTFSKPDSMHSNTPTTY